MANATQPADTTNPIVLIEPRGIFSKYMIVRYAHSKRKLVAKKSIWGYADSTNVIWRCTDNNLCLLLGYNSVWADYAVYHRSNRGRSPVIWFERGYSRTLDSKVRDHWSDAMEDVPAGYVLH